MITNWNYANVDNSMNYALQRQSEIILFAFFLFFFSCDEGSASARCRTALRSVAGGTELRPLSNNPRFLIQCSEGLDLTRVSNTGESDEFNVFPF